VVAEGSVVFDQADVQRITVRAASGTIAPRPVTSSTQPAIQINQDGTRIYFTADRVERVSLDTIVATNVQVTACDEDVPKWSFQASKTRIKTGDRVYVYSPKLKIKTFQCFSCRTLQFRSSRVIAPPDF
jgi:hypothetical protein